MSRRPQKCLAWLPRIGLKSSSCALKIALRDLNFSRRAFAFAGPTWGKPSKMYWSCSSLENEIFDGLREVCLAGSFFAKTDRYFAVSSGDWVKIIGTLNSNITERRKPRNAFSCRIP